MNLKALVVCSDKDLSELLRDILQFINIELIPKNKIPDIILMDIAYPNSGSLEIIKQIRKEFSVPIIIFSGLHDDDTFRENMLKYGACSYLPKPFMVDELIQKIKDALKTEKLVF